jgi:uncharacterized membrane protein
MKTKAIAPKLLSWAFYLFAAAVIFFTGVMFTKILPYLTFERAYAFLGTKPDKILDKQHFIIAFYIHILSSGFALGTGVFQFSKILLKKRPTLHRYLGKIYVSSILFLAAPTGLIISFYANGGMSSRVGFVLQSMVWWTLTYWAYEAIRKREILLHCNMMIRSFAITLAAMSLRTESYFLFTFFETKPLETYETVTWLSWVGNLLLAELMIHYGLGKRIRGFVTIKMRSESNSN